MSIANSESYLSPIIEVFKTHWPENRTINIVCHGHSVPSGYFATPMVDTFNAYPHLLHRALKERFPFAVINVIVTAIGGENAQQGEARFKDEVLCHRPDVLLIDYALNDRGIGIEKAATAWTSMIKMTLDIGASLLLLTPTPDKTQDAAYTGDDKDVLSDHANQIRQFAGLYNVGLVDSLAACRDYVAGNHLSDILSWPNHPNRTGHEIVTKEIMRWFPPL